MPQLIQKISNSRFNFLFSGPSLTLLAISFIEILADTSFRIPNPPAILLSFVVYSGFKGGLPSGLISSFFAWVYFAFYFSLPGNPFHYDTENFKRVCVWLITTPCMAIMVGVLKKRILDHELRERMTLLSSAKEQMAKEEAMREKKILTTALEARNEFISLASHELKTPFTSLKLYVQMHERIFSKGIPPDFSSEGMVQIFGKMNSQIDRLNLLIENMLDLSRINNGLLHFRRENCDLLNLVSNVVSNQSMQITKSGSTLTISPSEKIIGFWDPTKIEQVIINLLSNSLKFGRGRPIQIKVKNENGMAIFEIRDFGIGIAKSNHDIIFNRFEQGEEGSIFGGLGLGLYISKKIISLHGGRIWLDSDIDQGSTFFFELPEAPN